MAGGVEGRLQIYERDVQIFVEFIGLPYQQMNCRLVVSCGVVRPDDGWESTSQQDPSKEFAGKEV